MANAIYDWSTTAATNSSADATINQAEGMLAATVNNSSRAEMARIAAWIDTAFGGATYGGSASAYTITSPSGHAITSYAQGMAYMLKANHTCTGASTVNIDAISAQALKKGDGSAMSSGDIVSGGMYFLIYDGANFQVVGSLATGTFQPLDTDLTAIAALTSAANKFPYSTGAGAWAMGDMPTTARTFLTTPSSANLAALTSDETGTGSLVFATSPTLVTPLLGTPTSGTLTSCTGLPISTGVSGLAAGVATFLATPSSANLLAAITDETGTGANVFATSPTLVTPLLGTPTSGTLTSCTGLPISTGVSGLATGVATFLATPSSANLLAAITDETGTGANVFATSPTLVTPLLGTPTSGTLTSCTGLPISTGVSGLAAGVATFLATSSSANLLAAVTDETGTGALVFGTSPTLVTPLLGTPTSGTLTNATGLPISTGVSGLGTGVATFLATPSSANLIAAVTNETGTGSLVFATSPTLVTPLLGTPTSGTLTNATGLPISTGVSGLAAGVATFLATSSSANLLAAVTDETGTGALVFGTSPTITTPTITGGTSSSRIVLSGETTGTLTSASANTKILASGGITLPNAVFAAQDIIMIEGNGTARTITRGASVTMYIAGVDSASGTLNWKLFRSPATAPVKLQPDRTAPKLDAQPPRSPVRTGAASEPLQLLRYSVPVSVAQSVATTKSYRLSAGRLLERWRLILARRSTSPLAS